MIIITENDVGGEWMEIKPSDPQSEVTLTKVRSADFIPSGNVVTLALFMSVIGVIGFVAIVYLLTRRNTQI